MKRTTLILDDDLFRRAKRRAVERNQTVSDVVNAALRELLGTVAPLARPFNMITYGASGRPTRHEPSDFAVLLDEEDRTRVS